MKPLVAILAALSIASIIVALTQGALNRIPARVDLPVPGMPVPAHSGSR